MHAVEFISLLDGRTYTFPETQTEFNWNFGNLVPATKRLPGMSGGYDPYGYEPAPSEIGNVRIGYTIASFPNDSFNPRYLMDVYRDTVMELASYGLGTLWVQPTDPTKNPRFCYARINSENANHNNQKNDDLMQRIALDFQVPASRWYSSNDESGIMRWGRGSLWGSPFSIWGGFGTSIAVSSTSTTETLANVGTAASLTKITIAPLANISGIYIRRRVNGVVQDEVSYTGALAANDVLVIDRESWSITLNDEDAYNGNFDFLHPDWMRLMPGSNTIEIEIPGNTGTVNVGFRYFSTWY